MLAAIKGEKTMSELAQQFDVRPNQIKQWKDQALERMADVFDDAVTKEKDPQIDVATHGKRTSGSQRYRCHRRRGSAANRKNHSSPTRPAQRGGEAVTPE